MAIPINVIFLWFSTHASIPAGWARETSLDSVFPKGTAVSTNPNVPGGSATHSHTSTGHIHTQNSHSHTVSIPQLSDSTTGDNSNPLNLTGTHNHPDFSVSSPSGGGLQSTSASWAVTSSDPAFYSPIFIRSNGGAAVNSIGCLWSKIAGTPTGWTFCDGSGGTPDLRNKYLKGAAPLGDAGATGGTINHSHVVDHTHTVSSHTHSGTTSTSTSGFLRQDETNGNKSYLNHTHPVTLDATTAGITAFTGTAGSGNTVEPSHKKLAPIRNTAGVSQPNGLIGMWLGTLVTVPSGWALCDGTRGTPDMRGFHVKMANTLAEIGNTGGSNTHAHTAHSHVHTASSTHTHTGSAASDNGTGKNGLGGHATTPAHTHPLTAVTSTSAVYSTDSMDSSSTSNEPAFLTVAFVQKVFDVGGGLLMATL